MIIYAPEWIEKIRVHKLDYVSSQVDIIHTIHFKVEIILLPLQNRKMFTLFYIKDHTFCQEMY